MQGACTGPIGANPDLSLTQTLTYPPLRSAALQCRPYRVGLTEQALVLGPSALLPSELLVPPDRIIRIITLRAPLPSTDTVTRLVPWHEA